MLQWLFLTTRRRLRWKRIDHSVMKNMACYRPLFDKSRKSSEIVKKLLKYAQFKNSQVLSSSHMPGPSLFFGGVTEICDVSLCIYLLFQSMQLLRLFLEVLCMGSIQMQPSFTRRLRCRRMQLHVPPHTSGVQRTCWIPSNICSYTSMQEKHILEQRVMHMCCFNRITSPPPLCPLHANIGGLFRYIAELSCQYHPHINPLNIPSCETATRENT